MPTPRFNIGLTLFGLTLIPLLACAQQQSQGQTVGNPAPPIQPVRLPLPSGPESTDQNAAQPLDPDTRPPAGAQDLSLGTPSLNPSTWQPFFGVNTAFNSNPLVANNQQGWTNWTTFDGGIDLQRISENNQLGLYYLAGGSISSNAGVGKAIFQTGSLSEQIMWGRSTISFFDSVGYLPQASFGFAGANGVPLPPGGVIGLQPGFIPNDAVLTLQTQRLTNSFVTQVHTQLTRRSSFTFLGGFNTLHYFGTDLLNSDGFNFQGGYNYRLTREDTISLSYSYSGFRYSNYSQSINSNSVGLSYSRRVTGQLAFRFSAGPSFSSFQAPITGIPTSGGTGGTASTGPISLVHASLNAGLTYEWGRTTLGLNYLHGISGGSGVLAGALSDNILGSSSRQLTRTLTGGFTFGYSRNSGRSIAAPTSSTYNSSFAAVNLSRRLGPSTTLSLNYQFQYQNSSAPACAGSTCGTSCVTGLVCTASFTRNGVWLTLSWKKQPIVF